MTPETAVTKQQRWRAHQRARGLCIKCTTPAAPYAFCEHHRLLARVRKTLNRMSSFGIVKCDPGAPMSEPAQEPKP